MRAPHDENGDALAGAAAEKNARNGRPSDNASRLLAQARCEHCDSNLPKRKRGGAGRHKRFYSSACRVASSREKARFQVAGYNDPSCYEIVSRSPSNSIGCDPGNRHPYPTKITAPIDILGRGYRWCGASKIDRKVWASILWREVAP